MGTGSRGTGGGTGGGSDRSGARPSPLAGGMVSTARHLGPSPVSQDYAETLVEEHPAAAGARARAAEVGVTPVSPGTAAALTFLAATLGARSAVEIGTGTGVSALALVSGLHTGGVLTTVDIEGEHHRLARTTMGEAGIAPTRARLINGRALDVLPRLTDGAYDVVLADADPAENPEYLTEALRLLRPGGAVAFTGALAGDAAADPSRRDAAATQARSLHHAVLEDERLTVVLLPVGNGLLVATVTG